MAVLPSAIHRRRRRRLPPTSVMHLMLRDAYSAMAVDQALKALIAGCRESMLEAPGIVMIVVDESSVRLHLSAPNIFAPAPWRPVQNGLVWQATVDALQRTPIGPDTRNDYRHLVTLGLGAHGRVFVDLTQSHGLISIGGPTAARLAIARRLVDDLSTNPWSNAPGSEKPIRIVLVGLDGLSTPRSESVASIEELDVDEGGVVFIDRVPSDSDTRVREFAASGAWTVIVVDAVEAAWQFTADADGGVTSHFLPAVTTTEIFETAVQTAVPTAVQTAVPTA